MLKAIALILTVAAPAPSYSAQARYLQCVTDTIATLDDGISGANIIAIGADQVCAAQKREYITTMLVEMNINPAAPIGREIMETQLRDRQAAITIILKVRTSKR